MEMCIDILIVLFQLIHQSFFRLVFPKALGACLSDLMIPLTLRPFETAALVIIWKICKAIHLRFACSYSPKSLRCQVKFIWRQF